MPEGATVKGSLLRKFRKRDDHPNAQGPELEDLYAGLVWRPIAMAPKGGEWPEGYVMLRRGAHRRFGRWQDGAWQCVDASGEYPLDFEPTRWAPIPAAWIAHLASEA